MDVLKLIIESTFDGKGITAAANSINKIDRQINSATRTLNKFVGLLGAGGIGAAVYTFAAGSVKAYSESEKAITKLTKAMQNLGSYTEDALKEQLDFAASLQATTKYSDEQVMAVQTVLTTYGLYGAKLKEATKAALDMATQTGDETTAANILGKAYQGNTGQLARMGITIKDTVVGAQKFDAVMEQVQKRFGGMAAAEGSSLSGTLVILNNQVDDLKENIGSFFVPVLKEWAEWTTKILDNMTKLVSSGAAGSSGYQSAVPVLKKQLEALNMTAASQMNYGGSLSADLQEKIRSTEKAIANAERFEAARVNKQKEPGKNPPGAAADPGEERKRNAILTQIDDFYLTERGRNYTAFFGKTALAAKRSYVAQAASAEDMKDRQKQILRELEMDYQAAGRTFSGGFTQAMIETEQGLWNFKEGWNQVISGGIGPAQAALKDFFNAASEDFGKISQLIEKTFKGILNSFYDMITQMIAKYMVFKLLTGIGLGGTAFGKFIGLSLDTGGPIPGAKGAPMPILAHGGEFVLSANVVDAIKNGRQTSALGASGAVAAAGGGGATINQTISVSGVGSGNVREICRQIAMAGRQGVTEALDAAKVLYKQGAKRSGETAL